METTSEIDIFSTRDIYETAWESLNDTTANFVHNATATGEKSSTLQLYTIFIPIFGTIIVILNLIVVISSGLILNKGTQPRATYMFLGNVAMADLITGFAVIFGNAYPSKWRDFTTCCIQLGLIVSTTVTSIYSVALIAVDRFLYILHGLQYQQWVTPLRARLLIILTWIIGFIIGFLPLMGWYGIWEEDKKRCWFILLSPPSLILLTTVIGFFPVLLVCVLYGIILYNAIKKVIQLRKATGNNIGERQSSNKMRMFRGGSNAQDHSVNEVSTSTQPEMSNTNIINRIFKKKPKQPKTSSEPSKWKAIKVVMFTTGSFVITWVPYFIACCLYVYCDEKETPEKCRSLSIAIASPLAILGFMNSLFNPLIYAWWHKGFRMQIKKQICAISPVTSSKNTSSSSGVKSSNGTKKQNSVASSKENISHNESDNGQNDTGSTDL